MGCAPAKLLTKRSLQKSQTAKLNPRYLQTMSRYSTLTLNLLHSRSSPIHSCLSLTIYPPNPKCAQKALNLLNTQLYQQSLIHLSTYNKIRSLYSILSSDFSDFCNGIHASCIKNFSFKKALKIFLVSIQCSKYAKIEFLNETPYIEVIGNLGEDVLGMMRKWKALVGSIKVVMENENEEFGKRIKELKEFQKTVEEYSEFVLKPARLVNAAKYLQSAVDTVELVFSQASGLDVQIRKLLTQATLKNMKKKLNTLKCVKNINVKSIVHTLYQL